MHLPIGALTAFSSRKDFSLSSAEETDVYIAIGSFHDEAPASRIGGAEIVGRVRSSGRDQKIFSPSPDGSAYSAVAGIHLNIFSVDFVRGNMRVGSFHIQAIRGNGQGGNAFIGSFKTDIFRRNGLRGNGSVARMRVHGFAPDRAKDNFSVGGADVDSFDGGKILRRNLSVAGREGDRRHARRGCRA